LCFVVKFLVCDFQLRFIMDDPNITMEEYIRLEEEKVQRHAIVFDDTLTPDAALSYEPTVSPLNENEIDFRISFDESDDEDYMPTVSYSNDLDYFKDFETEFLAIVYNDALMYKLDPFTEFAVSPHHIDILGLKNDTSLSKYDEEEQNVVYFNDLFLLNMIYPDNLKSDKCNTPKNHLQRSGIPNGVLLRNTQR
ncbi:hypothetical protein Tco_0096248, partial [Tanacetum coccineum]